ncbi:MAG: hypothetical protein IPO56_00105 [Flavobacteriales bacterium]|nr:hypothetical protein [Flavobacteriales bacterium]
MRTLRPLSIAFLSLIVHGATAQDEVRIADIAQMVRKPDLAQENSVRSGLQAAGVEDDRVQQVLSMGKASNLPLGLRTDSALAANAASVKNYNAHKVCTYADEGRDQGSGTGSVNEIYHMPEDLHFPGPLPDPESAVEMTLTDAQRPKPSRAGLEKRMRQARSRDTRCRVRYLRPRLTTAPFCPNWPGNGLASRRSMPWCSAATNATGPPASTPSNGSTRN